MTQQDPQQNLACESSSCALMLNMNGPRSHQAIHLSAAICGEEGLALSRTRAPSRRPSASSGGGLAPPPAVRSILDRPSRSPILQP